MLEFNTSFNVSVLTIYRISADLVFMEE